MGSTPDFVDDLPDADVLDALDTRRCEGRNGRRPTSQPAAEGAAERRLVAVPLNAVGPEAPVAVVVHGFILEADLTGLFGDGDAGKSSTAYHVAVCVASGSPVFGVLEVVAPGPVLIITSGEDRAPLIRNRCEAFCAGLGLDAAATENVLARIHVIDTGANLHDLQDLLALQDLIGAHQYRLLLLDPIADLLGDRASTIEDRDARLTYRNLRLFLLGIAPRMGIVIIGHATKDHAEKTKRQRVFGSAAWTNGLRAGWFCERTEEGLRLDSIKANRWGKRTAHTVARSVEAEADGTTWRTATLALEGARAPSDWKLSDRRALSEAEREALAALDRHRGEVVTWSTWAAISGLKKNTLSKAKRRLLDLGYVSGEVVGMRAGKPIPSYAITGSGLAALLESAESAPSPPASPPDSYGAESASPRPYIGRGSADAPGGGPPSPPATFEPVEEGYFTAQVAEGPPPDLTSAA